MRIRRTVQAAIDTLNELAGVKSGLAAPDWKLLEILSGPGALRNFLRSGLLAHGGHILLH